MHFSLLFSFLISFGQCYICSIHSTFAPFGVCCKFGVQFGKGTIQLLQVCTPSDIFRTLQKKFTRIVVAINFFGSGDSEGLGGNG